MTKKKWNAVVALVALVCVSAGAYLYQRRDTRPAPSAADRPSAAAGRAAAPDAPQPVEVAQASVMTLKDDVQAVGSLRSRQGVMLRPEAAGRIAHLGFKDGQRVRRGQVLVQLDDTLQRAQVLQAQAQASIARTNLQRNRELSSQNFVSQSAVDQTAAALEVAEAQVALAQAQLLRMRMVAPFDGVAGIRLVNVGDYVKDGADLVNLDDVEAMYVDFRLPEGVLSRLKPGLAVDVSLDGLAGRTFRGRVDAFDSQLDANGRSLLVRATLPNGDGVLRPGMFARARLLLAERTGAVVVPEEALVPQGGRQFVLKVIEGPKGPVTQRAEVRLGLRVPGKAEVLQGVAAGDRVVTAGQARLMRADGLPVKVVQLPVAGSPRASAAAAASAAASAASR